MKKFFIGSSIILGLILILGILNIQGMLISPWEDKDKALLKTLKKGHLTQFENLLKKRANPNRIFGINPGDWVMCEANQRGKEKFLELAIKYGGNINLRGIDPMTKKIDPLFNAPILCAIVMHNYDSFHYLLQKEVNLDIKVWLGAKKIRENHPHIIPELWGKTLYGSPVIEAAGFNEYRMVYDILKKRKNLSWEEQWSLKKRIETGGIDPKSEAYQWRFKVADLLRKRGYEINLK